MARANTLTSEQIGFWSFLLSFSLLPIGLGGDRPIPLGIAQIGMAISYFCIVLNKDLLAQTPFFARLRWVAVLIVGVIVWSIIQTLPIVPESWTHPLWQETAAALKLPVTSSISIVPEDALKGLFRLLTYIMAGILGYIYAQDSKRARKLVASFWVVGTGICLYGLAAYASGMEKVLWINKWAYKGDLTGTFINRNHFSLYAGMIFTAGLGLLAQSWSRMMRGKKLRQNVEKIREWLLHDGLPRIVLLAITFVCILLSHSRAGLVCSMIGIASFLLLYQIYVGSWIRAAAAFFFCIMIVGIGLNLALETSDRFSTLFEDYSSQERSRTYDITRAAISDNPLLGYGLNGFEPEFRLYQRDMYEMFNHAHSDLLESILDLGIVGAGALWLAIGILLTALWHGITHRRQDGMFPTLAFASSLMLFFHSAVDFDMQIPGLVMSWTVLMGVGLSQSWQTSEKEKLLRTT